MSAPQPSAVRTGSEPHCEILQPGLLVADRYRLLRVLGEGAFGTVWEAAHLWTERQVALKILRPELASQPVMVERFLHEARATTRLKHPNVIEVLDMGRTDQHVFMAMELLHGETLEDRIARGPLDPSEAEAIVRDALNALQIAHAEGIVHRDLKPANLFLGSNGSLKVLDFGIAKSVHGDTKRTQAGMVVGTPEYMAPEQLEGGQIVPQTDLWALGVVIIEMVTGTSPFAAPTVGSVFNRILTTEPEFARVPSPLRSVAEGLLVREPSRRLPSVEAVRQRLDQPPPPSSPRRQWIWLIALLGAPFVAVGALWLSSEPPTESTTPSLNAAESAAPRDEPSPTEGPATRDEAERVAAELPGPTERESAEIESVAEPAARVVEEASAEGEDSDGDDPERGDVQIPVRRQPRRATDSTTPSARPLPSPPGNRSRAIGLQREW